MRISAGSTTSELVEITMSQLNDVNTTPSFLAILLSCSLGIGAPIVTNPRFVPERKSVWMSLNDAHRLQRGDLQPSEIRWLKHREIIPLEDAMRPRMGDWSFYRMRFWPFVNRGGKGNIELRDILLQQILYGRSELKVEVQIKANQSAALKAILEISDKTGRTVE